jgi:DNA-binding SARP family transcriptional activator
MSGLVLSFLGTPRVERDGEALTFSTRKTLALLTYLATEETAQSHARLADLLWPESDGPRATLRRTLAYLRDALGQADTYLHIDA